MAPNDAVSHEIKWNWKILLCLVQFVSKFWNINVFKKISLCFADNFSLPNLKPDNFFSQLQLVNNFFTKKVTPR